MARGISGSEVMAAMRFVSPAAWTMRRENGPESHANAILAAPAEQEQCFRKWVQFKLLLHNCSQAVDSPAQVGTSYRQVDLPLELLQHDFMARSRADMVASSAPLWISAVSPPTDTVATQLPVSG